MKNRRFAIVSGILALLVVLTTAGVFIYREHEEREEHGKINKLRSDPDAGLEGDRERAEHANSESIAGNQGEGERGPVSAAEEDYANRAYPAAEIPLAITLNAQASFNTVKGRGNGKNKKRPGQWTLIGPSQARFPGVLTFTGADYVTSGRITALAITPKCTPGNCRLWVGAAGGGIWRTDKALSGNGPDWTFVSAGFASNAIGTLTYDAAHNTLYAGTGEPNASGDSEAGVGIYKSTDGGNSWTKLAAQTTVGSYSGPAFDGRSISSIVVDPANANKLYVSSARGVRGVSSVTGGSTSNPPVAAPFGLYLSTDGGATFSRIWDGNASVRGVNHVELDPGNPARVYAAAFQQGIWRSTGGGPFEQVFAPTAPTFNTDRAEFALTTFQGHTRIYVGDGAQGAPASSFWRVNNADVAASSLTSGGANVGWTSLTSSNKTDPHYGTFNYCTGQCWYDNYVVTPQGHPDIVYLGGSFVYDELGGLSNARGVVLSTDAGEHFTDMTADASSDTTPNGIHPDQHALVVNPNNPYIFFEGSDGGLVRSSGDFKDQSGVCTLRELSGDDLTACHNLLSRVPSHLFDLNKGLSTLQFQSLSVNPADAKNLMGGTQDNGTFETTGSSVVWPQIIYGDGGQSGFDVGNPAIRFNNFFGQTTDTNFQNGDPTKWVVTSGPLFAEGSAFYKPQIADPTVAGTFFTGLLHVWRTKDNGGNQAYLEANCPEFTTPADQAGCGDWVALGGPALTSATLGTRAGGTLAAVERTNADNSTLWAATSTGRVFISTNANAEPASSVSFTRLDTLAANAPGRFVTSIFVDPANGNHAWISYSGYNFNTPAQPGHVFEVTYNPATNTATWTNLDGGTGPMGDLPVTDLVRDNVTGDLYAATDFGVLRLEDGNSSNVWTVAGSGLPMVEVAGLTIVPGARVLYAATHGRSAWKLTLP